MPREGVSDMTVEHGVLGYACQERDVRDSSFHSVAIQCNQKILDLHTVLVGEKIKSAICSPVEQTR
jgi:hypothetical protein